MKTTANRLELLKAAKYAAAIAPATFPVEVLKTVLVSVSADNSLTVSATNLDVALRVTLPCVSEGEDAFILNARQFAGMLEKLPGETVTLSRYEDNLQLTLRSEKAYYQVPIQGGNCFPRLELPFPEDTVKVSGIPSMIKRCAFAVDRDRKALPIFKCVNLMFTQEGLKAAGSDGKCVATIKGDEKSTGDLSVMLPAASLEALARICADNDEFRVGTTGSYLVFIKDAMIFSARIMDGQYIDTDALISRLSNQFTVLADIVDLRAALYSTAAIEPDGMLMLGFDGNRLTARCDGAYATAVNTAEVIPLTGTPKGEYWYISRQLMECLRVTEGMVTIGVAQNGMLNIRTENSCYLQTSLRPPAKARNASEPLGSAA